MLASSQTLALALLCLLFSPVHSCSFHGSHNAVTEYSNINYRSLTAENIATRSARRRENPPRMALKNVRVFNNSALSAPCTIIIENGLIEAICTGSDACQATQTYDGNNMVLLPGLIDSHAHPNSSSDLTNLSRFGVTTTVNAFCPNRKFCDSLANHSGQTSVISASFFATVPGSEHAALVGPRFDNLLIHNASEIPSWVAGQIQDGAEFIKLIGSAPLIGHSRGPGLSQNEQTALVTASHQQGKSVVLHTSSYKSYEEGLVAGVDQIHHSTLDVPVDRRLLAMFKGEKAPKLVCPTLTMMRAISQQVPSTNGSYSSAEETVRRLHNAGVSIIAGTDSNTSPSLPGNVPFGASIHDELENLVAAGLTPVEALNAATTLPAKFFGLVDRGVIRERMRADLVLVAGDPTIDITATRNIVKVWVGGVEVDVTGN